DVNEADQHSHTEIYFISIRILKAVADKIGKHKSSLQKYHIQNDEVRPFQPAVWKSLIHKNAPVQRYFSFSVILIIISIFLIIGKIISVPSYICFIQDRSESAEPAFFQLLQGLQCRFMTYTSALNDHDCSVTRPRDDHCVDATTYARRIQKHIIILCSELTDQSVKIPCPSSSDGFGAIGPARIISALSYPVEQMISAFSA